MSRDVQVKPQIRGINQVMRGPGARRAVNEALYRAQARAGEGHRVVPAEAVPHRWVARGYLEQESASQAKKDPNGLQLLRAIANGS